MEQKILLVDLGNSSFKWMTQRNGEFSEMKQKLYPANINREFFQQSWNSLDKPQSIVVSCVADELVWQSLKEACLQLWQLEAQRIVSRKEYSGLINAYETTTDLGSDRWCAMIAARHFAESAYMVIDLGSAVTIDLVDNAGQHLGGYIVPGLNMMKDSLGLHTAQVKVKKLENDTTVISAGNSTTACVEAGVHLSILKLIETVYLQEKQQHKNIQCYLTGGNANVIKALLPFNCTLVPDLVLRGLAEIYNKG